MIVMPVSIAVHAQKDTMHIVGIDTTVEFKSVQIRSAISDRGFSNGRQYFRGADFKSRRGASQTCR